MLQDYSQNYMSKLIYQMKLTVSQDTKDVLSAERNIIPCYVFTGKRNNYQPTPMEKDSVDYSKVMNFMFHNADSPV